MTDDPISRIEAALEAGPTLSQWEVLDDSRHIYSNDLVNDGEEEWRPLIAATCDDETLIDFEANARFIAACNPAAIRTLLDRLKDLEMNGSQAARWAPSSAHWSSELRRLFGADARDGIGALEQRLCDAEAEIERLRAELAEASKDAARYQWLRDKSLLDLRSALAVGDLTTLDSAIDSAMRK